MKSMHSGDDHINELITWNEITLFPKILVSSFHTWPLYRRMFPGYTKIFDHHSTRIRSKEPTNPPHSSPAVLLSAEPALLSHPVPEPQPTPLNPPAINDTYRTPNHDGWIKAAQRSARLLAANGWRDARALTDIRVSQEHLIFPLSPRCRFPADGILGSMSVAAAAAATVCRSVCLRCRLLLTRILKHFYSGSMWAQEKLNFLRNNRGSVKGSGLFSRTREETSEAQIHCVTLRCLDLRHSPQWGNITDCIHLLN